MNVATRLRKGMIILFKDLPHEVLETDHHSTGRGGSSVPSRLRNLTNGIGIEYRWRPDEKFQEIELDQIPMEFLYQDGEQYCFMNSVNFDQVMIHRESLGEALNYLTPNLKVRIFFHEGQALRVVPPVTVTLAITDTGPNVKGSTVTASTKPATLETGLVVQVPLFVETGEKIIVKTADGSYESRAKE